MKSQKDERGFTLIEMVAAIALLSILGAVIVPEFTNMTTRARMSADVSTVQVLQNQMEIYYAETGAWPGVQNKGKVEPQEVVNELVTEQWIDPKYLDGEKKVKLQTEGAELAYNQQKHQLYVKVDQDDYEKIRKNDQNRDVFITSKAKDQIAEEGKKSE